MSRSLFLEILDEEASIARGAKAAFPTFADLQKMLEARKQLLEKIDIALRNQQLTPHQREQLTALTRKHALPSNKSST
jgi:hypothetical protein